MGGAFHLRLPATSANLGPGFDALALALTLALEIDASAAEKFSIAATGRDVPVCSSLSRNLMLDVYQKTLAAHGRAVVPLALTIRNGIPIGMGCGSSASARLAGLALANHFGELGWGRERVLAEASRLEGHPDNAAACWLGGLAVAAMENGNVHALSVAPGADWRVLLAVPTAPLSTTAARAVLPETYGRQDAVFNIQRSSLLCAAFAAGRGDLLRVAMQDRLHQPYRGALCPLLPGLASMAGEMGVLGVALSGAGPSVLLLLDADADIGGVSAAVRRRSGDSEVELIACGIETRPALACLRGELVSR